MKSFAVVFGLLASATVLTGCDGLFSPDNFDEPTSMLTGNITYQGQPIPVASDQVELDLWQPGAEFELEEDINLYVDQDGSFSAALFDGDYEYSLINGQGPWADNGARVPFQVRGNTTLEIPVTPYYTVGDANISLSGGSAVQATFTINSVDTSRAVEYVGLYVSTTAFVDRSNQVVRTEMNGSQIDVGGSISLSVNLPDDIRITPSPDPRTAVFARVGIKVVGKADMIFSLVEQVPL